MIFFSECFGDSKKLSTFAHAKRKIRVTKSFEKQAYNGKQLFNDNAEIAQLVEHNLAKVGVASSSLVFRSMKSV